MDRNATTGALTLIAAVTLLSGALIGVYGWLIGAIFAALIIGAWLLVTYRIVR